MRRLTIVINGRDHLRFLAKIEGDKLTEAYAKLSEIHNVLCTKLKFAFNPQAGFLCSDLQNIGSGGLALELGVPCGQDFTGTTKAKQNVLVTLVKQQNLFRIKARARFNATLSQLVSAAYDVAKANLK